jgi:hypothetical protein
MTQPTGTYIPQPSLRTCGVEHGLRSTGPILTETWQHVQNIRYRDNFYRRQWRLRRTVPTVDPRNVQTLALHSMERQRT